MQVAEDAPGIGLVEGGAVGQLQRGGARHRLQQVQVRAAGLVPAGEQPVDHGDAALGSDHQLGPAATRTHQAVVVRDRLQHPHHRGADRDHPAAGGAGLVHQPGGDRGHLVRIGQRPVVVAHHPAGVQPQRGDQHAAGDQVPE
jgi:hypothetical protein